MKCNITLRPRDSDKSFCHVCKYLPYLTPKECYKIYRKEVNKWEETETKKHK